MRYWLESHDASGLLAAAIRAVEGPGACLSLEGDLSSYALWALVDASDQPIAPLVRTTQDPLLGFVVIPLSPQNVAVVLRATSRPPKLGEDSPIVHVQIAVGPRLVFGAYDNFHPDCTFIDGMPYEALVEMQRHGVIGKFEPAVD